ncbi:hypothetical protein N8774_00430 [Gammaproteobacteria bacterium]|nr:hypothetical protein [Gammaproteobacteria bacterium]
MAYSEINWYCDTDYMMNVWNNCGQKGTTLKDPNINEFVKPLLTVFDDAVKEKKYKIGILQRVNNKEEYVGKNWKSAYIWGFDPFYVKINGDRNVHGAICDVTKPLSIEGPHLAVYTSLDYNALALGYTKYWGQNSVNRKVVTTKEIFGAHVRTDDLDVM